MAEDDPPCPPLVMIGLRDPHPGYLLGWELVRGEWWAWVTWIRERNGKPFRHVVSVRAASVRPAESGEAYADVPRRVRGQDGVVRPWTPPWHHAG